MANKSKVASKNKIHAKPLDEIVNFIQGDEKDKKSQKKAKKLTSQQKLRVQIDEGLKKLQEMNADLIEVNSNIKQTQTQLNQLQETNGKNKKQKMATAQNNLKNLNKRHAQLEKEAKTMLCHVRGISTEVDLDEECKGMAVIKNLVPLLPKKKKTEETKEEQVEPKQETVVQENNNKHIKDPDPSKSRFYSLFGDSPIFGRTFAKPPHFSEFNNAPQPERVGSKNEQTMLNGIDSFRIPSSTGATPTIRNQMTMQSYRANPSSCLVKNANGIFTVRDTADFPNPFNAPMNFHAPSSSHYSSNLVYETSPSAVQNRHPPPPSQSQYPYGNPLQQFRDREIDPFGCWRMPSNYYSKPSGF